MNTAITRPSSLNTEQGGGKNRRKDLQLFQKMELKYVKEGRAYCQNTGGFLFLPPSFVSGVLEPGGERGSVGISGFLFHRETLAREILIVDPCGQDLEILPSQSFLVLECSWNWPWLSVTWVTLSEFVRGMGLGFAFVRTPLAQGLFHCHCCRQSPSIPFWGYLCGSLLFPLPLESSRPWTLLAPNQETLEEEHEHGRSE